MSSSSTDSNDEYKTPRKAKRRYRRTIHHGISERMAKYHQQAPPATSESLAAVRTEMSFSDVRDRGAASASTPKKLNRSLQEKLQVLIITFLTIQTHQLPTTQSQRKKRLNPHSHQFLTILMKIWIFLIMAKKKHFQKF